MAPTLTPDDLKRIVERYDELAAGNGALGLVAIESAGPAEPEILDEFVDVARQLDLMDEAHDHDQCRQVYDAAREYLAALRLRFVPKTLVVRLPVIVDEQGAGSANAAPEPVIVEGVRTAVATIPFLELADFPRDGLPVRLAVTLEDRS